MNALALVRRTADPEVNGVKTTEGVLAGLRLERVALVERLAQISGVLSKLEAAEDGEREALGALGELGLAEVIAVKSWACGGCEGAAPTPDMERRDALNRKLGEAMAAAEAMRAVAAQMKDEQREVSLQLAAISERIEAVALDALSERFAAELGGFVTFAEAAQSKMAKTYGCTVLLREIAEKHQREGRSPRAVAIYRLLEQLSLLEKPEFSPSVGAVAAAAPAWKAIYEGFISND